MQALEGIIKSLLLAHKAKKMAHSLKNTTQQIKIKALAYKLKGVQSHNAHVYPCANASAGIHQNSDACTWKPGKRPTQFRTQHKKWKKAWHVSPRLHCFMVHRYTCTANREGIPQKSEACTWDQGKWPSQSQQNPEHSMQAQIDVCFHSAYQHNYCKHGKNLIRNLTFAHEITNIAE